MQPPVDHVLVRTTKPKAAAAVRIGAGLGQQKRVELAGLLQVCFARGEPWLQAREDVSAEASGLGRRNGWAIAEQAGDRSPDKTQRLLNRAVWDTWGAMGVVRRFAVAGLDEAAARSGRRRALVIGALDETGQCKSGQATAGVKRQYLGCAGKVANGINTVHLSYVREQTGHALIGARRWIPARHLRDPAASAGMGRPADLGSRPKWQRSVGLWRGAVPAGGWVDFVAGGWGGGGGGGRASAGMPGRGWGPPPRRIPG